MQGTVVLIAVAHQCPFCRNHACRKAARGSGIEQPQKLLYKNSASPTFSATLTQTQRENGPGLTLNNVWLNWTTLEDWAELPASCSCTKL